jgi:hypothetical protein
MKAPAQAQGYGNAFALAAEEVRELAAIALPQPGEMAG